MKREISILNRYLKIFLGFLFIFLSLQSSLFAQDKCTPKQLKEFKTKYFKIQEFLNYAGKDTKYDSEKDKLLLTDHRKDEEYGGQVFESYLFKRYQNIVSKIAYIAGQRKKEAASFDKSKNLDSEIISFFESIDDDQKKIAFDKIGRIAEKIAEISSSLEDKYQINKEEIYLLKNLLIHAEDTKCRQEFLEDKKSKVKLSAQDEAAVKVAREKPINILLGILRKNKQYISQNYVPEELVFVDQEKTINEAVFKHLEDLRNWLKNDSNKSCANFLKKNNGSFLKNDIQECNYQKFIANLLDDQKFTQIESILHFINANESGPRKNNPIAETGLNEKYFNQKFNELSIAFDWKVCVADPSKDKDLVSIDETIKIKKCQCSNLAKLNDNKCERLPKEESSVGKACQNKPSNSLADAPWVIADANSCTCKEDEKAKCCSPGFKLSEDKKSCVFDVNTCGEEQFVDKDNSKTECKCKDNAELNEGKCVEKKKEDKPKVENCKPEGIDLEAIVEVNWFKKDNKCICEQKDACCKFQVDSKDGSDINNKSYIWDETKNTCTPRALTTGGGGKGKKEKEEEIAPMYTAPNKTPPTPFQPRMIDVNGGGFTTSGQR